MPVPWRKGYLYQFTGSDWIELDPKECSDKYMVALNDLLEGAPDAIFNNIFCGNLLTNQAFIKYLQVLSITLSELTENGVTKRGEIKSSNFVSQFDASPQNPAQGFRIMHNGDAEFNNGKFRGHIEADSGTFHGRVEANEGSFTGEVNATSGEFTGRVNATSGSFSGTINATSGYFYNVVLRNIVENRGYGDYATKYIIRDPLDGTLLQGNYTTAQFITALDSYFGTDKIATGSTANVEFKCSGTVSLTSQNQGESSALIVANIVGWSRPANTWFIRGTIIQGSLGIPGAFINLNLNSNADRNFTLNLCLG